MKNGVMISEGDYRNWRIVNGHKYDSGDDYEGDFNENELLNGNEGKVTYKNGQICKGRFVNGVLIKGLIREGDIEYVGTFNNYQLVQGYICNYGINNQTYICEKTSYVSIPEGEKTRKFTIHSYLMKSGDIELFVNMECKEEGRKEVLSHNNGVLTWEVEMVDNGNIRKHCNQYFCTLDRASTVFTLENISIVDRVKELQKKKSITYLNGERNGEEHYFYQDGKEVIFNNAEGKGRILMNGNLIYEGGLYQKRDVKGEFLDDFVREGMGKGLFDDDGEFEGNWSNDQPLLEEVSEEETSEEERVLPISEKKDNDDGGIVVVCPGLNISFERGIEQIEIQDGLYNEKAKDTSQMKLAFTDMPSLKSIRIGKKCFMYIHSFILKNLPNLEKIEIGDECFTVGSVKRKEGCFTIAECSNLQSIEIGEKSFHDYNSFNLSHLPSLSSIHIKVSSFSLTPAFELKDLPVLEIVQLDGGVFQRCQFAVFDNLPKLKTIVYGKNALEGKKNCENKLVMKNLPSLTSIEGNTKYILMRMGTIELENIPSFVDDSEEFGFDAFAFTHSILASNADNLERKIRRTAKHYNPKFSEN